jgi:hypothetical protein
MITDITSADRTSVIVTRDASNTVTVSEIRSAATVISPITTAINENEIVIDFYDGLTINSSTIEDDIVIYKNSITINT